jgi:hypothetical protein
MAKNYHNLGKQSLLSFICVAKATIILGLLSQTIIIGSGTITGAVKNIAGDL